MKSSTTTAIYHPFLRIVLSSCFLLQYCSSFRLIHTHNTLQTRSFLHFPKPKQKTLPYLQPYTTTSSLQLTPSTAAANLLTTTTSALATTSPITYFFTLLSAGFGIPVSEDAICIFVGTFLNTKSTSVQLSYILALYLGVICSDIVTFWIGRLLNVGIFQVLRNKLLPKDETTSLSQNSSKHEKLTAKIKNYGNAVGIIIRLSIGMRGPLMLLSGFSKTIPFSKFVIGTSIGACFSLSAQLLIGYTLRENMQLLAGILGGLGTAVLGLGVGTSLVGLGNLLVMNRRSRRTEGEESLALSRGKSVVVNGDGSAVVNGEENVTVNGEKKRAVVGVGTE